MSLHALVELHLLATVVRKPSQQLVVFLGPRDHPGWLAVDLAETMQAEG